MFKNRLGLDLSYRSQPEYTNLEDAEEIARLEARGVLPESYNGLWAYDVDKAISSIRYHLGRSVGWRSETTTNGLTVDTGMHTGYVTWQGGTSDGDAGARSPQHALGLLFETDTWLGTAFADFPDEDGDGVNDADTLDGKKYTHLWQRRDAALRYSMNYNKAVWNGHAFCLPGFHWQALALRHAHQNSSLYNIEGDITPTISADSEALAMMKITDGYQVHMDSWRWWLSICRTPKGYSDELDLAVFYMGGKRNDGGDGYLGRNYLSHAAILSTLSSNKGLLATQGNTSNNWYTITDNNTLPIEIFTTSALPDQVEFVALNGDKDVTVTPPTGKEFSSILVNGSAYTIPADPTLAITFNFTTVTADQRIDIVYSPISSYKTITFDLGTKGVVGAGFSTTQHGDIGATIIYPQVSANSHYTFTGWDITPVTITDDSVITAQYQTSDYTVEFLAGSHGVIDSGQESLPNQTVTYGTTVVAPTLTADTNWQFDRWANANNLTETVDLTAISADTVAIAIYTSTLPTVNNYSITTSVTSGIGEISSSSNVVEGGSQSIIIAPGTDSRIDKITVNGTTIALSTMESYVDYSLDLTNIQENKTVQASFAPANVGTVITTAGFETAENFPTATTELSDNIITDTDGNIWTINNARLFGSGYVGAGNNLNLYKDGFCTIDLADKSQGLGSIYFKMRSGTSHATYTATFSLVDGGSETAIASFTTVSTNTASENFPLNLTASELAGKLIKISVTFNSGDSSRTSGIHFDQLSFNTTGSATIANCGFETAENFPAHSVNLTVPVIDADGNSWTTTNSRMWGNDYLSSGNNFNIMTNGTCHIDLAEKTAGLATIDFSMRSSTSGATFRTTFYLSDGNSDVELGHFITSSTNITSHTLTVNKTASGLVGQTVKMISTVETGSGSGGVHFDNFIFTAHSDTKLVTFDLAGKTTRTGGGELVQVVATGADATAPTIAAIAPATFIGWDKNFTNITKPTTVNATYQSYTVTYTIADLTKGEFTNYPGQNSVTMNVVAGETPTAPEVTAKLIEDPEDPLIILHDWEFFGWDTNVSNVSSDITTNAIFRDAPHLLEVVVNGVGQVSPMTAQVYNKGSLELTLNPLTGYQVQTISFDGQNYQPTNIYSTDTVTIPNITTAGTINVTFEEYPIATAGSHNVVFKTGEHGVHNGGGALMQTVIAGSDATSPTITAKPGYTFTGWSTPITNIQAPTEAYAVYAEDTYTVTFVIATDDNNKGQFADRLNAVQTVASGAPAVAPTIVELTGYEFSHWDTDFTNITANTTVTAVFTAGSVNDAPYFVSSDLFQAFQDIPFTVSVMATDDDDAASSLTLSVTSKPSWINFVDNGDGTATVSGTASNLEVGIATVIIQVQDTAGLTAQQTLTIDVYDVNDLPTVVDDSVTVDQNTTATIDVLANDSDLDGDTLSVAAVTQPTNGSVTINGSTVEYTPNLNYFGNDSFTYTATDGFDTVTGSVNITVTKGLFEIIVSCGFETTDYFDTVGDGTGAAYGRDAVAPSGRVDSLGNTWNFGNTANPSTDDVTFWNGFDGTGMSGQQIQVFGGTPQTLSVGDFWSVTPGAVITSPYAGTIAFDSRQGTDTVADFNIEGLLKSDGTTWQVIDSVTNWVQGPYSFNIPDMSLYSSYRLIITREADPDGVSRIHFDNIIVSKIYNTAPVAQDDVAVCDEDSTVDISVLGNDTDEDGNTLTVQSTTQGINGTVTTDGTVVTYTPNSNFNGVDTFTYTTTDGIATDTATVTVTVNAVNDVPVAVNDTATTDEDVVINVAVLTNDTDIEGDTLSIQSVTQASNGTVAINGTTIDYTPNANWSGADSFTYTVTDGTDTAVGTVNVTVNAVNDAPIAVADSATTAENSDIIINVLTNDTDVELDSLSILSTTQPSNGTVSTNGSSVTYTPNANFFGSDSFIYTVTDGTDSDTATVSVTVNQVNEAPVAVNDTITGDEDSVIVISVLANDSDNDGDNLTIQSITQPTNGVAVINGTTVEYTPTADFYGTDSLSYTISDGNENAVATVNITVNPVGAKTFALYDANTNNPTDASDVVDPLTVDGGSWSKFDSSLGSGDIQEGVFVTDYTTGKDVYAWRNMDSTHNNNPGYLRSLTTLDIQSMWENGWQLTAIIRLEQNGQFFSWNTRTSAPDGTYVDNRRRGVSIAASGSDVTLTPQGGTQVTITDALAQSFVKIILSGNPEEETYTFTVYDLDDNQLHQEAGITPASNSSNAYVGLQSGSSAGDNREAYINRLELVSGLAPIALTDSAITDEDTPAVIDVLANDSDANGDTLAISEVSQGTNGATSTNGSTVTYTPTAEFSGNDSFTYTVTDGTYSKTTTVNVTVNAVNDAPVAIADAATTDEDVTVNVAVLGNDTDIESDTLSIQSVTQGANGTVAINGTTVDYTPNADWSGADSFTYTVTDGTDTAVGTVNITVNAVNDAPMAIADAITTDEDVTVNIAVLTNDTDVELDTLSVQSVTQGTNGTVAINGTTVDYTPNSGFYGTDSFTYTTSDGNGGTDTATVNVTVNQLYTTVPNVVGTDQATAEANIVTAQLTVGTISELNDEVVPAGDVISQSLTAGSSALLNASVDLVISLGPSIPMPKLYSTVVPSVGTDVWVRVNTPETYTSMVVVATPRIVDTSNVSMVTRIANVTASSFDIIVQRIDDGTGTFTAVDVDVMVAEEGVYTAAECSVNMEVGKHLSSVTTYKNNYNIDQITPVNTYTTPVVLGQVMSFNDSRWSMFWACDGNRQNVPSASSIYIGKAVGEDPDYVRNDETLGYMIIESGVHTVDGVTFEAGVGADSVKGFDDAPGYNYNLSGSLSSASAAILSANAFDGGDQGTPVLYGLTPVTYDILTLVFAEDTKGDSERKHTAEQAAYIVFE